MGTFSGHMIYSGSGKRTLFTEFQHNCSLLHWPVEVARVITVVAARMGRARMVRIVEVPVNMLSKEVNQWDVQLKIEVIS